MPTSSALERVVARSSKRYYPSSKLHGITLRKTVISITTSMEASPAVCLWYSRDHLF